MMNTFPQTKMHVNYLYFLAKPLDKIFIDNAIGRSKESQDMRYKVLLI